MPRLLFRCVLTLACGGFALALSRAADAPSNIAVTLKGHTEAVYAIAYSPDGKQIATGSFDKTVRLWDAASGKETKVLGGPQGHQNLVLTVAYSPDGKLLASGGQDNVAKVWEVAGGAAVQTFAHADGVNSLALSPDGKILAGAGKDGTVRVWNAADGKMRFDLKGHKGPVLGVAFAPDGKTLASSGSDGSLRFWNPADGKPLGDVSAHTGAATAVSFLPNNAGLVLSVGADGLLKSWKLPLGASRALAAKNDNVSALALSANGNQLVLAGPEVRIVEFATGKPVRTLKGNAAAVEVVAVSPNDAWVAAGTADQRFMIWNASGAFVSQPVAAKALAFHPQSTQLVSGVGDGTLKLWPLPPALATEPPGSVQAHAGGVLAVAFSVNGSQVLSGGADKTAKLWNVQAGKEPFKEAKSFGPLEDAVRAVAFHPNGTQVVAAGGKTVKIWNAADGKEVATFAHPAAVTALAFSPDKTKLVTGAADQLARVWDLGSGKEIESFRLGAPVRSVAFHNSSAVVALGEDRVATAFTPSLQKVLSVSAAPVRALAIIPAGTHALTAGDDKQVKLWNLASGANERTYAGAAAPVTALAVSKNTALVASGDGPSVRVYNFADGKPVGTFKATGPVRGLAFSPNTQLLSAASGDKTLTTWHVGYTPGQPTPADFGKLIRTSAHDAAATDVVFAPDSSRFYSSSEDKSIRAWTLSGEGPSKNFAHPALVDAVAFNPESKLLATGCHDGNLRVWDLASGQAKVIAAHLKPTPAPIYCVAWSPDGKQLVTGSFDHTLKLWDVASGNMVREFKAFKEKEFEKGHQDGVFCVAFSPDGKTIASGGSDRSLKIWNLADGSVVREFANPNAKKPPNPLPGPAEAHPGWIYGVRFTPDGQRLVSAGNAPGNQGYLAVWNVADGKLLSGQELPLGPFYSVALSPDGKLAAVACGPRSGQSQEANGYVLKLP